MDLYPWHGSQWQRILSMADSGRLPHALLLSGPQGIGLTGFAACLTARLHCQRPPDGAVACGECRSCIQLAAGSHPDLFRAEPEEEGGTVKVESIRDLIDFIHLSSQYGGYKIAWIHPADAMNRSSANSLLKILEEPPGASLLMLITHQPSRLPITLRSRCQRLEFHPARDEDTLNWLAGQLPDAVRDPAEILELAGGAPLRALEFADPERLERREAMLHDLLNLRRGPVDPAQMAQRWLALGVSEALESILSYLAAAARLKLGRGPAHPGKSSQHNHLQQLADELDLAELVACYDFVAKNRQRATGSFNLNAQGLLEEVIVLWQSPVEQGGR